MQRDHAVGRGDQRHLIGAIERLVPHPNVVAAVGGCKHALVVRPPPLPVHRLDHKHGALARLERPAERVDHAERVLPFGDAEVIEHGEQDRSIAGVGQCAAKSPRPRFDGSGSAIGIGT